MLDRLDSLVADIDEDCFESYREHGPTLKNTAQWHATRIYWSLRFRQWPWQCGTDRAGCA